MSLTSIATTSAGATPIVTPVVVVSTTSHRAEAPAVAPVKPVARSTQKPSAAELQQAVEASNKVLAAKTSNELHFAVEKGTGLSVVKLISRQSGETILQFPSEAMLQIAKGIDQVTGAIIQQKA
jgi:flagellar protein FlaG